MRDEVATVTPAVPASWSRTHNGGEGSAKGQYRTTGPRDDAALFEPTTRRRYLG
jgi:hypothetical protein